MVKKKTTRKKKDFYTQQIETIENTRKKYAANVVLNQKYNIVTFLPLVLCEQVKKKI
jgi:hypothetical protein